MPLLGVKSAVCRNLKYFSKKTNNILDLVVFRDKIMIMYDFYITYFIDKARSMANSLPIEPVYRYTAINDRLQAGQGGWK